MHLLVTEVYIVALLLLYFNVFSWPCTNSNLTVIYSSSDLTVNRARCFNQLHINCLWFVKQKTKKNNNSYKFYFQAHFFLCFLCIAPVASAPVWLCICRVDPCQPGPWGARVIKEQNSCSANTTDGWRLADSSSPQSMCMYFCHTGVMYWGREHIFMCAVKYH